MSTAESVLSRVLKATDATRQLAVLQLASKKELRSLVEHLENLGAVRFEGWATNSEDVMGMAMVEITRRFMERKGKGKRKKS